MANAQTEYVETVAEAPAARAVAATSWPNAKLKFRPADNNPANMAISTQTRYERCPVLLGPSRLSEASLATTCDSFCRPAHVTSTNPPNITAIPSKMECPADVCRVCGEKYSNGTSE